MIHDIKTSKDIILKIDDRQITDFNFVRALADVESKDEGRIINGWDKLAIILFGKQYDEILDSLKDDDGYIPTDNVIEEIKNIFEKVKDAQKEIKN